jgi:hypothetical protein
MIDWSRSVKPKALEGLKLNRTWTQEFIERPYFSRPMVLPSGRATPETLQNWKVEDFVENSKGTGQWRSIEEGRKSRHRSGKACFQAARQGHSENEDSSYLLVSADVPQEAVTLPESRSHWSAERGHHFITGKGEPIEGPMTLQELLDEVNRAFIAQAQMVGYEKTRQLLLKEVDRLARVEKLRVQKEWNPYWEGMTIDPEDQVKTTVHYKGVIDGYDLLSQGRSVMANGEETLEELILRRGFEWTDFQFLMGSRVKDRDWEAWTHGNLWSSQGEFIMNGGSITVVPSGAKALRKKAKQEHREEDAWKLIA